MGGKGKGGRAQRTWQKGDTSQRPVNVRMKPPSRALWKMMVRCRGQVAGGIH